MPSGWVDAARGVAAGVALAGGLQHKVRGFRASPVPVFMLLLLPTLAIASPARPPLPPQMCTELDRRLRLVYNRPGHAPLVLDAHVMSGAALKDQAGQGARLGDGVGGTTGRGPWFRGCPPSRRTPCCHSPLPVLYLYRCLAWCCRRPAAHARGRAALHHLDPARPAARGGAGRRRSLRPRRRGRCSRGCRRCCRGRCCRRLPWWRLGQGAGRHLERVLLTASGAALSLGRGAAPFGLGVNLPAALPPAELPVATQLSLALPACPLLWAGQEVWRHRALLCVAQRLLRAQREEVMGRREGRAIHVLPAGQQWRRRHVAAPVTACQPARHADSLAWPPPCCAALPGYRVEGRPPEAGGHEADGACDVSGGRGGGGLNISSDLTGGGAACSVPLLSRTALLARRCLCACFLARLTRFFALRSSRPLAGRAVPAWRAAGAAVRDGRLDAGLRGAAVPAGRTWWVLLLSGAQYLPLLGVWGCARSPNMMRRLAGGTGLGTPPHVEAQRRVAQLPLPIDSIHPPLGGSAGMPCGVDAAANAMLPPAVRSSRATNLFHAIKATLAAAGAARRQGCAVAWAIDSLGDCSCRVLLLPHPRPRPLPAAEREHRHQDVHAVWPGGRRHQSHRLPL